MAAVKHVTDTDFKTEVLDQPGPVLVDFWAPWCGPCQMLGPVIERLAQKFEGRLKVCKLNTDENPKTAGRYGILSIPTLILFKAGQEVHRLVGYQPEAQLIQELDPRL